MPGNPFESRLSDIKASASLATVQQATLDRQDSTSSNAKPDPNLAATGGLYGAARTALAVTLNFFTRQPNQQRTVSDKPSTSPADEPEEPTNSTQSKEPSAVHRDQPLRQLQTSHAVTIPDAKGTPGYWRTFSDGCRKDCNDKLLHSSARDMTIDLKPVARPISELTFVNSSGVQCVRNPGHELRLHVAASVGGMSTADPSAASSSTTRSSAAITASSSSPSITSPITLHGHSKVFAQVRSDAAPPVKQAQQSGLALAQSPDDTSNDQEPKTLQRSLSASDAHPGNNPLTNRNAGNDWLLYALQSNRSNMLQFVSRNSHVAGSNGKEVPLLTQLKSQLAKAASTGTEVKLDEQHTLVSIDHDPNADQWKGGQHAVGLKTATLTVKVQQDGQEALKRITLTQVAPPFENRLLKADHLKIVHDICKDAALDLNQTVVFSYAGMGRNATLAVYDQLAYAIENGSITTTAELEESMRELVKSGRSVHHQNFVHSDEQLAQLFSAAYHRLVERYPAAAIQTSSHAANQNIQVNQEGQYNQDGRELQERPQIQQLASTFMRNVVAATQPHGLDDNTNSQAAHGFNTPEHSPASNASSRRSSVDDARSHMSDDCRSVSHDKLSGSGSLRPFNASNVNPFIMSDPGQHSLRQSSLRRTLSAPDKVWNSLHDLSQASASQEGSFTSGPNVPQDFPHNFMHVNAYQTSQKQPDGNTIYTREISAGSSDPISIGRLLYSPDIQDASNAAFKHTAEVEAITTTEGLLLTPVQSEEETQNAAYDQRLFFNDDIASRDSTPRVSESGVAMNSERARASSTLHPQRA